MRGIQHNVFVIVFIVIIVVFISNCKKKSNLAPESKSVRKPIGLILEKKIEGIILGQKIVRPKGVASDNAGNIYFIDAGNNRIIRLDRDCKPVRDAGGFGSSEGLLNSPEYIALDNNLNLYISETGNQRISIFDSKLNFADRIDLTDPDDPLKFGRPSGLMVSNHGELWVADPENSRISLFNNFNNFDRFIGDVESYSGLLLNPSGIKKGRGGKAIIVDSENAELFIFDSYGILDDNFGDEDLVRPMSAAEDSDGNIWVVDIGLPAVLCFDNTGRLLFSEGSYGRDTDYNFMQPYDIAILPGDKIIISDTGNDRLVIYKILYM